MFRFFVLTAFFAGSVFVTSDRFVDTENSPKFYFVVLLLAIAIAVIAIKAKYLAPLSNLISPNVLKGIYAVYFIQAVYGIFQYLKWLPSNHSEFEVTGSFDNPAGFAATLSLAFPIGLFLFIKSKNIERYLIVTGLSVIVFSVFLSGSRAGMLAIIVASIVFGLFQKNVVRQIKQNRYYRLLVALSVFLIFAVLLMLYNQKKDSANGRLLIWKISYEMIKDKPVSGHGYGTFKANYMDYQARYFAENPDSKYSYLADNIKHPFNEFILVSVEFGIFGFIVVFLFILFILRRIKKSENEFQALTLSGLIAFLTFASFSYPLHYVAVWLLLTFYFSFLLPHEEIRIKYNPYTITGRAIIVITCSLYLLCTFRQVITEIKWNTIAQNSLNGCTIAMIPEYDKLYPVLRKNPFFLYNYGAELSIAKRYDRSIDILMECQKRFNDYDLQLLLADNYQKKKEFDRAIQIYEHASNMIPWRFWPLYQIFEIYKETRQKVKALEIAKEITGKEVKIPAADISSIKEKAQEYIKNSINDLKGL